MYKTIKKIFKKTKKQMILSFRFFLLFYFFNLYFYIIIHGQLLLCACLFAWLTWFVHFFFFVFFVGFILFAYYFSITFPIRLIAQGCVFFCFFLCVCSFLVNRLIFEKKKRNWKNNSMCFVFLFGNFCLWFFFAILYLSFLFYPRLISLSVDKAEQISVDFSTRR